MRDSLLLSGVAFFAMSSIALMLILVGNHVKDENDKQPQLIFSIIYFTITSASAFFALPVTAQAGRIFYRELTQNHNAFPSHVELDRNLDFDPFA